jgi:hypothetical protein
VDKRTFLFCVLIGGMAAVDVQGTLSQSATAGTATPVVPPPALDFYEEPNWQAVCDEALATPLPAAAAALSSAANNGHAPADEACDEQALYYGFGKTPDYPTALRCAYRHRAHPEPVMGGGFLDGAGTLAMLYANGDGVPRNYALAIRFACEANGSGGQNTEERIGRLEALRDDKPTANRTFDLCDEQMSGAMGAYCSDLDGKKADVGRGRRVAAIAEQLPERARAMLSQLQAAEAGFEQARMRGENTGGRGSGSVGFALVDQNLLREQFVINLERFDKGNLPRATAADRERAQQQLDAAYGAVRALPVSDANAIFLGAALPTQEGYAATEAAWQALFAEWMRFVPVAFPELSRDAAATELLRLRIHQLKSVARYG